MKPFIFKSHDGETSTAYFCLVCLYVFEHSLFFYVFIPSQLGWDGCVCVSVLLCWILSKATLKVHSTFQVRTSFLPFMVDVTAAISRAHHNLSLCCWQEVCKWFTGVFKLSVLENIKQNKYKMKKKLNNSKKEATYKLWQSTMQTWPFL